MKKLGFGLLMILGFLISDQFFHVVADSLRGLLVAAFLFLNYYMLFSLGRFALKSACKIVVRLGR